VGGLLLGIGAFWILPELATQDGWVFSLSGVSAVLLALALINHYIYPICPFCAAGIHIHAAKGSTDSCRHTISLGWPLLVVGCIHSFFDGWTIAFSQVAPAADAYMALSWGAIIHKLPESVAIGILAARLTSNRTSAFATIALVQAAMAAGGTVAFLSGNLEMRHADIYSIPACAVLLLFGLLSLQEEWQLHGRVAAIRATAPGLLGCGLLVLASQMLSR
jgi:zinc transporter ZupT